MGLKPVHGTCKNKHITMFKFHFVFTCKIFGSADIDKIFKIKSLNESLHLNNGLIDLP